MNSEQAKDPIQILRDIIKDGYLSDTQTARAHAALAQRAKPVTGSIEDDEEFGKLLTLFGNLNFDAGAWDDDDSEKERPSYEGIVEKSRLARAAFVAHIDAQRAPDTHCRWPMCESKEVQDQAEADAAEALFRPVPADEAPDDRMSAADAVAMEHHTNCARCHEIKPTPLRLHDGYVCLTCIDKALTKYEADEAQGAVAYLHELSEGTFGDDGFNIQILMTEDEANTELAIFGGTIKPLYTHAQPTAEEVTVGELDVLVELASAQRKLIDANAEIAAMRLLTPKASRSDPAPSLSMFATMDDYKQAKAEHATQVASRPAAEIERNQALSIETGRFSQQQVARAEHAKRAEPDWREFAECISEGMTHETMYGFEICSHCGEDYDKPHAADCMVLKAKAALQQQANGDSHA